MNSGINNVPFRGSKENQSNLTSLFMRFGKIIAFGAADLLMVCVVLSRVK